LGEVENSGNRNYQERSEKWERDRSRKKAESGCMGGSDVDTLKEEERMEGRMLERITKRGEEWIL
jgi:hypothetical protein